MEIRHSDRRWYCDRYTDRFFEDDGDEGHGEHISRGRLEIEKDLLRLGPLNVIGKLDLIR